MRSFTQTWLLPLAALTGGCASTPEVRNLAERTGVFVTSLEEGTADFVAAQNRLNAENEGHLLALARHRERLRARVAQQQLASTRAGATVLVQTQSAASGVGGADVVARLHPRATEPAAVSSPSAGGYKKAAEALVEVGTRPDAMAVLAGLAAYAGAVREAHADLVEKAKKSATATAADTTTAAANAITGGAAATKTDKKE